MPIVWKRRPHDRMTFRQLSDPIAEKALVPIFVSPARAWTREHQLILGVLLALALALPALAFSIARRKLPRAFSQATK